MSDEFPRWRNNRRSDGVSVSHHEHGGWIVQHPDHPPLSVCPCCDRQMATERAAKRVADGFYPIAPLQ